MMCVSEETFAAIYINGHQGQLVGFGFHIAQPACFKRFGSMFAATCFKKAMMPGCNTYVDIMTGREISLSVSLT